MARLARGWEGEEGCVFTVSLTDTLDPASLRFEGATIVPTAKQGIPTEHSNDLTVCMTGSLVLQSQPLNEAS